MLQLVNSELRVALLDPCEDTTRLGSRYCSGGYVYQVTDMVLGDLLSGPAFPEPFPSPFDGQGLPEVFETALNPEALPGENVEVLGVGAVLRESPGPFHVRHNPTVSDRVEWKVEQGPGSFFFRTERPFGGWRYRLSRGVRLDGRTLHSETTLENLGARELPLRWFSHPFFPFLEGERACTFSRKIQVPENPGFSPQGETGVLLNPGHDWDAGCFQPLDMEWGIPLEAKVDHPKTGGIHVECDFPLAWLPVWANDRTFSFEPYLQCRLGAQESFTWAMRYHF